MRLGELLLSKNLISEQHLNDALRRHLKFRDPLGECLISIGAITENVLLHALSEQLNMPYFSEINEYVSRDSISVINEAKARSLQIAAGRVNGALCIFANDSIDDVVAWFNSSSIDNANLALAKKHHIRLALDLYHS